MLNEKEGTWIRFVLVEQKPKTQIWHVLTKGDVYTLGDIKWLGKWRRYAFYPASDTIYESTCLIEISEFLAELMRERKKRR